MAGEWRELPFSQAVTVNPRVQLTRGATYPFVDMGAVSAGSRSAYASEQRQFDGGGSRFVVGDTLMARITPCLENGKIARFAGLPGEIGHGSTEFIVIRGRDGVSDTDYAYYLTKWEGVSGYAISQMTGTSGRQRVPSEALDHLKVLLPPLSEQRAIAHILGTLDDKIELNRRMSETLEAMARALFKAWFVDFEPVRAKREGRWRRGETLPGLPAHLYDLFPDRLVESELGETNSPRANLDDGIGGPQGGGRESRRIPEGWEWAPASRLIEFNPPETLRKGTVAPYIEMSALPTSGSWPEPPVLRPFGSGMRFRNGDTLLARITPCLENGKTAFVQCLPDNAVGWGSTEFIVMRPRHPVPKEFGYLLARDEAFRAHAIRSMTGTSGRQRVQADSVANFPIAMPSNEDLWQEFARLVSPAFKSIKANAEAVETLAELRDTLLPKLISGELRIADAEKPMEKFSQ